jgi:hypothetical protein
VTSNKCRREDLPNSPKTVGTYSPGKEFVVYEISIPRKGRENGEHQTIVLRKNAGRGEETYKFFLQNHPPQP